MRHVQKVMIALALVIVFVFGLTGCGKTIGDMDLEEGQSAIYIQEDGKVSYAVSEKFDKDYYDEDKLEDTINEEVENYNEGSKASIKNAITVDTFKVKSDTATLVLKFATAYDFLTYITGYNNYDTWECIERNSLRVMRSCTHFEVSILSFYLLVYFSSRHQESFKIFALREKI